MILVRKTSVYLFKNFFVLLFTAVLINSFFISFAFADTEITEDILEDTTWTKEGSPYIINFSIAVMNNATLTIEPGVEVKFKTYFYSDVKYGISVFGSIKALGTESLPIYFTSNYDDFISNTDDQEVCNIEEYDEDGNLIKKEDCEYYDLGDPFSEDWNGIYMNNVQDKSIFNYVNFNYSREALSVRNSEIEINNVNISNSYTGLVMYENSSGTAKELNLSNLDRDAVVIFNDSFLNFDGLNITNVYNGPVAVFNNSSLSGKNLNFQGDFLFENYADAIAVFNGSHLLLNDSHFKYCPTGACIVIFDGSRYKGESSNLNIKNTYFEKGKGEGVSIFGDSNIFTKVNNSAFVDFADLAVSNYLTDQSFRLDFENNYFGDATGPYHQNLNNGGQGLIILGNVDFEPWLRSWPPKEECTVDCFSNVMFFPGVQGSRMYGDITDCDVAIPNACTEQQLWISNNKILQEYMFLDEYGKSLNDVYTKNDTEALATDEGETGIVDSVLTLDLYDSFINDLKTLKDEKSINDYALIPYDWRLSLEDIITNGKVIGNNLSYTTSQEFSESFILQKLRALQANSKSGRVTLIAHSTGGLVIKALVQKLKDTNDPLYEKIDKIIFVAVPQVGTPEATITSP